MEKQMSIYDFIPDPDVKYVEPWQAIPCSPMFIGYIGNEKISPLKKRIKTEKQMSIYDYDFILEPKLFFKNLFNTKKNFIDKKGLKTLANEIRLEDYCLWSIFWNFRSKDPYIRRLDINAVVNKFFKEKPIKPPKEDPVSLWDVVYWELEYYDHPKTFLKEVRK